MNKLLYLAYGSNINSKIMKRYCPTAKIEAISELPNHTIIFRREKEKIGDFLANIEPSQDDSVPVIIWEINKDEVINLDKYEDLSIYKKAYIDFKFNSNEKEEKVLIYVMKQKYCIGIPSDDYHSTIIQGYKEAGFDENIFERFIKIAAAMSSNVNNALSYPVVPKSYPPNK
jgi:gamma-glutamylcyclotransferase (GGCT)/AIG2-like uncharacterized protein YtfP